MTNARFRQWRAGRKLSVKGAAEVLGCSTATIQAYERDRRIPKYIALACQAISNELPPWE